MNDTEPTYTGNPREVLPGNVYDTAEAASDDLALAASDDLALAAGRLVRRHAHKERT